VRSAANGECSLVTDNGRPVAMIAPLPVESAEVEDTPQPIAATKPLSNAAAFRKAILNAPYPFDLNF
jgi:antitoxin (DNA-binding transcriptional repressor) of toxin-antitoxin stability system